MRALALAAAIALACLPAAAGDLVFKSGTMQIRLKQDSCAIPSLTNELKGDSLTPPRVAEVRERGRSVRACWGVDQDGDVLMTDERGTTGFVPREWFKEDQGI